ncbi:MAG: hypothetical protein WDZ29_05615 [Balneolaceae bacterium]
MEQTDSVDFWPHTLSGNSYNEFWTYRFDLDGDLEITMVFSVANFGSLKSPVSGVRISILGFSDRTYQVMREYPLDRLVTDRENWIFQLHPERDIWIEGQLPERHEIRFRTRKDGVDYDIHLELSNIQQGYRWGNGQFRIDGTDVGMYTHIPWARVSGNVKINDEEKPVRGTAYMDHTHQDKITTKLLTAGYRYIWQNGSHSWGAGHFLAHGNEVIGYSLSNRNGTVSLAKPNRISVSGNQSVSGHSLPTQVEVEYQEGPNSVLVRTRDRETFALLQELGGLARRIARGYLRGEIIEFRGEGQLESGSYMTPMHYSYFIVD